MARAKVLGPINEPPHPLAHQVGQIIKEGKDGQTSNVLDKEGKPIPILEKNGKPAMDRDGKPKFKTRFERFSMTDPRRFYTLQFGYNSIRKVDMNFVFPLKEER